MSPPYDLIERIPTAEEHRTLFEAVGWHPYTPQETEIALANTLYGIVAFDADRIIGMARVIGDRGKFFYIQDFAIRPEYQGLGVGSAMMDRILAHIKQVAPDEPFVGLFATDVAVSFYNKYGFEPHTDVLAGIWMVLPGGER